MLPFQAAVQEACARIGRGHRQRHCFVVNTHYSKKSPFTRSCYWFWSPNTINIGGRIIGAMASASTFNYSGQLCNSDAGFTRFDSTTGNIYFLQCLFEILKWLCISLFAYPVTVFIVTQPWLTLLRATFIPHIELNFQFLFIITGVWATRLFHLTCFFGRPRRKPKKNEWSICWWARRTAYW